MRQLKNYKQRIRGTHPNDVYGQQMYRIMQTFPDEQAIRDVVIYINMLVAE